MTGALLEVLAGFGIAWSSVGLGELRARRKKPVPPRTICGCGHEFALHDLRTGECHDKIKRPVKWDSYGDVKHWEHEPCTCRHYTGPIPAELEFREPPSLPRGDTP